MIGPLQIQSTPLDRVRAGAGPGSTGPIIGIDLGVASCKVAVVGAKGPECVSSGGQRSIAAALAVDSRGHLVVGHAAKRILASSPELGLWGPKALVDHGFHDPGAKAWRSQFRCEFFARPDGEAAVKLGDRSFAAHELVAMVLCEAREWAQNRLGVPVDRAVVTITPSLDGRFLGMVRRISLLAGLHLERTLFEPMAVLLAGPQRVATDQDGTAVVCDWGASGFRFALLRTFGTRAEILVSMGEPAVSGIELDRWLYQRILKDAGVDEATVSQSGGAAVTRLLAAAEGAKIALSTSPTVKLALPCAYYEGGVPRDLALEVKRETLEEHAGFLIDRALKLCEEVLSSKGLFPGEVNALYLVGDQSRMPLIQQRCRDFFYQVPVIDVDPTEALVRGAALLAASCKTP